MKLLALSSVLLMIALATLHAESAGAGELFARPVFTSDREFVVLAPVSITWVDSAALPVRVGVFDQAMGRCGLTPDSVKRGLERILGAGAFFWTQVDQLFPQAREAIGARGVTILIDDFSQFAGDRPDFASYYYRDNSARGLALIGLDCSRLARSYWAPSLAHEITHALLDGSGAESWWEEGLAQILEREVGGQQPALTTASLETVPALPHLMETRRPLSSRASYAINGLFVRYLQSVLGGWPALRAMVSGDTAGVSSGCGGLPDFLSTLACRAQSAPVPRALLTPDRLTRAGLLRYFAVALTLNDRSVPIYSIPGWSGWNLPETPALRSLAPGQFAAWKSLARLRDLNPNLEVYRVISNGLGAYRILPREQALNATRVVGMATKDYLLVLNLGTETQSLF